MPEYISKVFIITDGASRGNPGPASIAFGIYDEDFRLLKEKSKYIGYATSNEAEFRALSEALECAAAFCQRDVEHYSDSELLVKRLKGEYRIKAPNLKPVIEDILVKKKAFESVTHWHLSGLMGRRSSRRWSMRSWGVV
jgi:ribonuclease HI